MHSHCVHACLANVASPFRSFLAKWIVFYSIITLAFKLSCLLLYFCFINYVEEVAEYKRIKRRPVRLHTSVISVITPNIIKFYVEDEHRKL
jgi:hypothetical protein